MSGKLDKTFSNGLVSGDGGGGDQTFSNVWFLVDVGSDIFLGFGFWGGVGSIIFEGSGFSGGVGSDVRCLVSGGKLDQTFSIVSFPRVPITYKSERGNSHYKTFAKAMDAYESQLGGTLAVSRSYQKHFPTKNNN